jgi:hypothetical protein
MESVKHGVSATLHDAIPRDEQRLRRSLSRLEDQREQADHHEQANQKDDTDRATDELQHLRTSHLATQGALGVVATLTSAPTRLCDLAATPNDCITGRFGRPFGRLTINVLVDCQGERDATHQVPSSGSMGTGEGPLGASPLSAGPERC